MISILDYKTSDGKVDWNEYRTAKIGAGERCYQCGASIQFGSGFRSLCSACQLLVSNDGGVSHEQYIRCPKCSKTWDPYQHENYDLLEDGPHDVTCPRCDHEFEVETDVTYSFTSPGMIQENDGDDEDREI